MDERAGTDVMRANFTSRVASVVKTSRPPLPSYSVNLPDLSSLTLHFVEAAVVL